MSTMVLSPLAVGGIRFYQRFISPYKGFRCAHRLAKTGWSCSEFGRRVFARYDLSTAHALLQRRFAACKTSYAALTASHMVVMAASVPHIAERKKHPAKTQNSSGCSNSCDLPSIDVCTVADIGSCACSF